MPYSTVGELPQQVRGALDNIAQLKWLDVFNVALQEQPGDEMYAWKKAWKNASMDENARAISGILSREVVDDQHELVNAESLVREFNETIWKYGVSINDIHSNRPCGVWHDAELETGSDGIRQARVHGIVFKGKPYYDEFWNNIQMHKQLSLSVGLMKIDPKVECEGTTCWKKIDKLQVFEASAVPRGACPGAVMDQVNFAAKGATTMVEEEKGEKPICPKLAAKQAAEAEVANKESETGIAALQKILGQVAETNRRLQDLDSKLTTHIQGEMRALGVDVEQPGDVKKEEPGEEKEGPPGEEKKEDKKEDPKDPKKEDKKVDKMSDKAVAPPEAPTTPVEEDKDACHDEKKEAEVAEVNKVKDMAEKAQEAGATTPRPAQPEQAQGATPKSDSLTALLKDENKLRTMSAIDIEKFAAKYSKGEI